MEHRRSGLFVPADGRDSCGVGMAVNINGARDHGIVEYGLRILENLAHRGAENADGKTGDGSGITVQVPHEFILKCGIPVPDAGRYGTGILFLPQDRTLAEECLDVLSRECGRLGLSMIGRREVPVDHSVPGPLALESEPYMVQVFISSYDEQASLERKLFIARKRTSNQIDCPDFYICSLSTRTITYKGMLTPGQIRDYYLDLSDPDFRSAIAMVHSRFSTNTMPMWKLAQPFRMLCHNGEINTIPGNRSWMKAREGVFADSAFSESESVYPVIQEGMSDSASLDNVFEFLIRSGMSLPNAITAMVPESWNSKNPLPDSLKAYYEYHSMMMEPWDGPASLLFTDGRLAGGMLDRNGLRPSRYTITRDGLFILASESGVVQIDDDDILEAGRLVPGKMILIDTSTSRVMYDSEIKGELASAYPYGDWLSKNRIDLTEVSSGRRVDREVPNADILLREFSYTREDVDRIIVPMAENMGEPVSSGSSDIPLPILSDKPQLFFNYFRQSFAQVTNPPIDPIREELVMSLTGYIGSTSNNLLAASPENCKIVKVRHPVITNRELDLLKNL
ncbi:MAG: glutamate synthase subunit alpha, partial [archaeon]|nr:glutamate synthase subunit alpha [archaeon]